MLPEKKKKGTKIFEKTYKTENPKTNQDPKLAKKEETQINIIREKRRQYHFRYHLNPGLLGNVLKTYFSELENLE